MSIRDSLRKDTVASLRVFDPVELGPDGTVGDAIALMRDRSVGCVFITEHRKPIGVFTERDVLTKILAGNLAMATPIVDVMTPNPDAVGEHYSVAEVISKMHQGGYRHVPVVDDSGYLGGVVSVKRIVEHLVEQFPSTVFNLPPDPSQKQSAREGA